MNNRERRTDADVSVPGQDLDEPREHRRSGGKTLIPEPDEQGTSSRKDDADPGPSDDDGLPDNARRRVPS